MKNLKLLAALLALTIGLAGCGGSSKGSSASSSKPEKMLDGDNMIASPSAKQEYTEPEDVTYMRLLAGEDEYRACVLYLGGSYEVTTDVQQVLDSQTDLRELYCIFAVRREDTLFVYEKQDPAYPAQLGKELYGRQGGQPILLLCNGSREDTMVTVYCSTGRPLDWNPQLSGSTGQPVLPEGVADFSAGVEPAANH